MTKKHLIGAAVAALAMAGADGAVAQTSSPSADLSVAVGKNGTLTEALALPVGKSAILRFETPVTDVLIGDPEIADVIPLTDRSVYVIGQGVGRTRVTVFARGKQLAGVVDLNVGQDILGLKRRLAEMLPGEPVEVRGEAGAIILSGAVSDSGAATKASSLAASYAGEKGSVVNMMSIRQSQQVMLAVRFAEVQRSALKEVGISTDVFFNSGKEVGAFQSGRQVIQNFIPTDVLGNTPGVNPITDFVSEPEKFAAAFGKFALGDVSFDVLLDLLEKKGIVSVLAEPNLIAVSGQPASFLAGGEFPVPVASNANNTGQIQIQIEFKEFGVRLSFTPTVVGENINLVVEPEVSELDPQSGIRLNDIVIPGLTTRRVSTTVDLKNGQSFAIAGLLQRKFIDDIDQVPGIGDIPVLGALSRSAAYRREDTELAVVITAYLVEPTTPDVALTPADTFVLPSQAEFFLLGRTEGGQWPMGGAFVQRRNAVPMSGRTGLPAVDGSGVDGQIGFIVK